MHCPLCHEFITEGEDLQLHYLLNCSAYSAEKDPETLPTEERTTSVRFRWAKIEPCGQRIVHLISSMSGSIALHWSDIEGLYESALATVPLGKHTCQLAIGGDVITVEDFDIEEETDVMYIIPVAEDDIEEDMDLQENIIDEHDDPVADLLASTSFHNQSREGRTQTPEGCTQGHEGRTQGHEGRTQGHEGSTTDADLRVTHYDGDDESERNEDPSDGYHGNPLELSPLYKELLQHQVLHGAPSWIPSSGNQSPSTSDQELEDLLQRSGTLQQGPPLLTSEPAVPDDRLLKSPIPIKPLELVDISERTVPSNHGDENVNRDSRDVAKDKDHRSSSSSSSSSATLSGSTSKRSSGHLSHSPHSDTSDNSIPLQEQSLEESIPQLEELPCPYNETVLNTDVPNNQPLETATSHKVPATERPTSTDGNQSETRASPHDQPLSARSNQSETRATPLDRLLSADQSETRVSPHDQPLSARSNQSATRVSPHDQPLSARSNQSETRASPHDQPSSARSSQSETRASPHNQSLSSVLSPAGDRHTPPPVSPSGGPLRHGGDSPVAPVHSSSRIRQSPLTSGLHTTGDLPSPYEPSPSISHHSSARSTPHGATHRLSDRHDSPPNEYHVEGHDVHPRDIPALSHVPRDSFKGSTPRTIASDSGAVLSQGLSRHQSPGSSLRHEESGPGALEDLMIMGHAIPSRSSAFSLTNSEEPKANEHREIKELRKERDSLVHELRVRSASYEDEIKQLKTLNEELCQQLLSLEAAAAMAEQSRRLDSACVSNVEQTLAVKDAEIKELKTRCNEIEQLKQEMKDELESLKTVNKLTYEDLNKVNTDLLTERSDLRRKTYGSPMRPLTSHDDDIPQIENTNKTLRHKVDQLENEKQDLKHKYNDTKIQLEKTKVEKSISEFRLTKAKSEADLREKFEKFTNYKPTAENQLYNVSTNKADSSGLGSSRHTSDANFDTVYKTTGHTLLNGSATRKDNGYSRRDMLYGTSRRLNGSVDDNIDTQEHDLNRHTTHAHNRHRSLSSESSGSSLLEYEYGANIRIPYESYVTRDKRVELREPTTGRRTNRPHSFHAGTGTKLKPDSYLTDKHHLKSSSYTTTRPIDYTITTTPFDYGSSLSSSFSSESSYATRPYRTTTVQEMTGDYLSKPFMPMSSKEIQLGKRVVVTRSCGNVGRGIVRYVGSLHERSGSYVGVELHNPEGKHDGSFQGIRYFKCEPNRGIFVKFDKVIMCYN